MKAIILCQNRSSIINFDNVVEICTRSNSNNEGEILAFLNDRRTVIIARYGNIEKATDVLDKLFDTIVFHDSFSETIFYKLPE